MPPSAEQQKKERQYRRFKPTRRPAGVVVTSLAFVDAALLLLAFLICVSPFVLQPGVRLRLPASPFSGGVPFRSMVVAIPQDGRFFFNDRMLNESGLVEAFRSAMNHEAPEVLIIEADEGVTHGTVINVWNAALEAGVPEVSIATQVPKESGL